MARKQSKGTCTYCGKELSKAGMTVPLNLLIENWLINVDAVGDGAIAIAERAIAT